MRFIERLPIEANVEIRLLDKRNKVVYRDQSHNVFTNMGRNWLAESNRIVGTVPGPDGSRKVNVLPYYIAVGKGSDQQSITPPGPGTQEESALVTFLENPVQVTSGIYLAELNRATTEPDDYTNQYVRTFQESELSFGSQPSVPISEFGLITSDAIVTLPGGYKPSSGGFYPGTYDNGYLIAYRAIPPITKTANLKLQIVWELRF